MPNPGYVEEAAAKAADLLIERLASPEARGLAEQAVGTPGLDAAACSILADWVEDRRFPGCEELAGRVRRLPVEDGDLLVLTLADWVGPDEADAIRKSMDTLGERLAGVGRRVVPVVLSPGMTLEKVTVRGGPTP